MEGGDIRDESVLIGMLGGAGGVLCLLPPSHPSGPAPPLFPEGWGPREAPSSSRPLPLGLPGCQGRRAWGTHREFGADTHTVLRINRQPARAYSVVRGPLLNVLQQLTWGEAEKE